MNDSNQNLLSAIGTLSYSYSLSYGYKLIVNVDPEIVSVLRRLAPKYLRLNPQKYAPHISVVRKEIPGNLDEWGKYEGQPVEFNYSTFVYNDETYYWIRAYSDRLKEIRVGLGCRSWSELTRPPSGEDCFHITIGNTKTI